MSWVLHTPVPIRRINIEAYLDPNFLDEQWEQSFQTKSAASNSNETCGHSNDKVLVQFKNSEILELFETEICDIPKVVKLSELSVTNKQLSPNKMFSSPNSVANLQDIQQ